jgi:glutathione S-transferase
VSKERPVLKIYHSQGARSLRVLWLCEEMGVPYETAEASFFKPSAEFKAVNPLRTVPVMQDGDVTMIESVAMMIYIMSKYGPTDLEVKPNESGYAAYLQYLLFGEAGIAAYGNRHTFHGARRSEAKLDRDLSQERDPQAPRICR